MKILLVDDEASIERLVSSMIVDAGYEFAYSDNGFDALAVAEKEKPDLIIMDVMMPKMDGFAACREMRQRGITAPIIFLSAKGDIVDKGIGFQAGGDDYMVKPIELDELLLRIQALLRRAGIASSRRLIVGSLVMDAGEHTAYLRGEEVPLTVREFDLLFKLLSYPRKTFTRAQLMEEFWDADTSSGARTVDVYMTKLRDKLSACRDFEIVTVHGLGYKAVIK